ncbi:MULTISPECIES: MarC family protein [unclassified Acinetobacter]|uniref:MarC family protein n=1 Tax=unclassified Acinetobacter TaxID=196816 RepID=UPI0029342832|nr:MULTISPECIES: MarC family protein [unclassified Acinetobacter]WOE31866.1 MarC family protein [Acinetobacter sp. SAAs470]WOE37333.1 MarC family protein [Acinetobacter sp. SAAs474]
MNALFEHTLTIFMAFFAIMNPIANTAAFAGLTANMDAAQKQAIALKALIITFILICLFALLGQKIFHLFGITLPALRITGGILVFIIGYHMLQGATSNIHKSNHLDDDRDIAISPLAVPLLAGPGTIATAMSYSTNGILQDLVTIAVFFILCVITYICFHFSNQIINKIGQSGLSIVTRLMGLILAVIGTQMFIDGIQGAFKF